MSRGTLFYMNEANNNTSHEEKYIGARWYALTAIGLGDEPGSLKCECICGNVINVPTDSFKTGRRKTCGCKSCIPMDEKATFEKLWRTASSMIGRCRDKKARRYGGRGIKVCDDWLESKILFVNWAINNGYKPGLSIDRINNDGNYEPSNCRWATRKEQANNKGDTRMIFGQPLTPFCEEHGLNTRQVRYRLNVGDSDESAVFRARRQKDCPALETWCEREITNIQNMTGDEISKYFLEV